MLLAAAAGRATNLIDPWILMLSVWGGSFLGDQVWYTLGRRYGSAAVKKIPGAERKLATAVSFLNKYGVLFVLTFRFVYGVRNVASAACGVAKMPWSKFAALNFIAAGLWAGSFVAAGWFIVGWLGEKGTLYALGSIGVVVVLYLGFRAVQGWRRSRTPTATEES